MCNTVRIGLPIWFSRNCQCLLCRRSKKGKKEKKEELIYESLDIQLNLKLGIFYNRVCVTSMKSEGYKHAMSKGEVRD